MSHRERRKEIIESLKLLIKSGRYKDDEKLILFLMRGYGCTRRTALEYLKVAK